MSDPSNLGAELRRRREALRVTQVDLAERAGVNRATVRSAERGESTTVRTLSAIQAALDSFAASVSPTRDVTSLAAALTGKAREYERLADDCWRSHDYLKAIRFRGMAEAYRNAVEEDLIRFARGELSRG